MSKIYRVHVTGPVPVSITRRRSDAALFTAETLAYDCIAAQGRRSRDPRLSALPHPLA